MEVYSWTFPIVGRIVWKVSLNYEIMFKEDYGKALLTFKELRTVIYEIECTLNSRPLTYMILIIIF